MSGVGRNILNLVGDTSAPSADAPRRQLAREDLEYAQACRAKGWGWQSIAHQLRCNEIDLRRRLGDVTVPARPKPAAAPGAGFKPRTSTDAVLLAVSRGATGRRGIREATGLEGEVVNNVLSGLGRNGFLGAFIRGVGWVVTRKGKAKLAEMLAETSAEAGDDV